MEYYDYVILTFTPANPHVITGLEGEGEYIRTSAIVNIIDNDRKYNVYSHIKNIYFWMFIDTELQIAFEDSEYSVTEGAGLSTPIRLQFRSTQSPFNIILSPVTIATAVDKRLGSFINSDNILEDARATAGELDVAVKNVCAVDLSS